MQWLGVNGKIIINCECEGWILLAQHFCESGDEPLGVIKAGDFFTNWITIKYSRYTLYIKELQKSDLDYAYTYKQSQVREFQIEIRNKKFWEELIAYFPWYDTGHIEIDESNNSPIVACIFVTAGTFLPSRCLATIGGFLPSRCLAMIRGHTHTRARARAESNLIS
jgi:hypothetical protein